MSTISLLLEKLNELEAMPHKTALETDLMMDYTRQLYAALLGQRNGQVNSSFSTPQPQEQEEVFEEETHETQSYFSPIEDIIEEPEQTHIEADVPEDVTMPVTHFTATEHKQKDIRSKIGINDKYQIINELFGNDQQAYETAMNAINDAPSMHQALSWLDEHAYQKYNWNMDDEAAQLFYSSLSSFFSEV